MPGSRSITRARLFFGVDVAPPQSEHLASAHARECGEVPCRLESVTRQQVEECPELGRLPELDLVRTCRSWLRGLSPGGDVRGEQTGVECVGQGLVHDRVDIFHRLGAQAARPVQTVHRVRASSDTYGYVTGMRRALQWGARFA